MDVQIAAAGGRYVGKLSLEAEGRSTAKTLGDADCDALVDALALVAALERMGAKRVVLSTLVGNEQAQRVFRACGFRPTMLEMTRSPESG